MWNHQTIDRDFNDVIVLRKLDFIFVILIIFLARLRFSVGLTRWPSFNFANYVPDIRGFKGWTHGAIEKGKRASETSGYLPTPISLAFLLSI